MAGKQHCHITEPVEDFSDYIPHGHVTNEVRTSGDTIPWTVAAVNYISGSYGPINEDYSPAPGTRSEKWFDQVKLRAATPP